MSISNKKVHNSLVVVSAKEQAKIYEIAEGQMQPVAYVSEHPPEYSDDEGYFARTGNGQFYGSGSVKEEDTERNLERFTSSLTEKVDEINQDKKYNKILLLVPEHLKNIVGDALKSMSEFDVEIVGFGNYVEHNEVELLSLLEEHGHTKLDPSDPASVAGEENAEEKRKILEVAQMRKS